MSVTTLCRSFILLSLSVILAGCSSEESSSTVKTPRPVRLTEVVLLDSQEIRRFPAQVLASKEVELSFRVAGEVVEFNIKPSQIVSKGQVIARVDDRDFKTDVELKVADFDLANREFERAKSMREKQLLAQSDFDSAQARLNVASGALTLAKDRLKDTIIRAPFSGRVASTQIENHQVVQAQQPIALLQDDRNIDITIQLPEHILSRINRIGMDKTYSPVVTFNSSEHAYSASYKQHKTLATQGTQSYEVTFTMPAPNAEYTVYPGMGATLHLNLGKIVAQPNSTVRYVVPATAILNNDMTGQTQVWVYDSGQVSAVDVTTEKITSRGVVISAKLKPDSRIVSAGLNKLYDGMSVVSITRERGL
ncbi:efflux RND transporter periplasmic adaptor subunit [Vibrio sp. ZSDZ65]|uniref:Efflux RND transporter periplasmic adaptor subunit n=1 Tax=Vibrio qingdaonensis TaxID=2829491 RepID=A0A9X3CN24_9VIBR|nr:efflux RND transporter periplasmic adaptor subunit [Vibrio qingdaonensis]MCW8346345.1 efflux RND transporter periplasmic adaptor subunit [Vibrio qingdaonensis]